MHTIPSRTDALAWVNDINTWKTQIPDVRFVAWTQKELTERINTIDDEIEELQRERDMLDSINPESTTRTYRFHYVAEALRR